MSFKNFLRAATLLLVILSGSAGGQEVTATYAVGNVSSIDGASQQLKITTKLGEFTVQLNEKVKYLRVQPGETNLEKAVPVALADVAVGDQVTVLGRVAVEQKIVPARTVVLMKQADIAQAHERERAEWRQNGIAGRITSLDPEKREVVLLTRSRAGEQSLRLTLTDAVSLRRYPPDAVKFSEAVPGKFEELKLGDQVYALGEKGADGKSFTPRSLVAGSFRMVGGKITAINAAGPELVINDLQTNRPVTVVITDGTTLRRIRPQDASTLLQKPATDAAAGDPAERLPETTFSELKVGDTIIVSSTTGANPARVTAILLATGAEVIINAGQRAQPQRRTPNTSLGLPTGFFDNPIGLP
jgi:hypothetical protein